MKREATELSLCVYVTAQIYSVFILSIYVTKPEDNKCFQVDQFHSWKNVFLKLQPGRPGSSAELQKDGKDTKDDILSAINQRHTTTLMPNKNVSP